MELDRTLGVEPLCLHVLGSVTRLTLVTIPNYTLLDPLSVIAARTILRGTRCPNMGNMPWSPIHWRLGPCPSSAHQVRAFRSILMSCFFPCLACPPSVPLDARGSLPRTDHSHKMSQDT